MTIWALDFVYTACCPVACTLGSAILYILDWVLSHWANFTVHRFIRVYLCVFCVCFFHTRVDLMGLKSNP